MARNIILSFVIYFTLNSNGYCQSAAGRTLYLLRSSDGTTFTNEEFFLDSADVPSLVQDNSGMLIATYQSWRGQNPGPTWDKIGVRFSSDNGVTWTPHQVINISGWPGTIQRAFDPTITVTQTGEYRLYFSYCPNNFMLDSTCDTYSAISTDAINFTFESGMRMNAATREVIDPAVTFFNNTWYYCNPIGAPQDGSRYATSTDGLNFTLIDSIGLNGPNTNWTGNLMNNGSTMRFYGGSNAAQNFKIWWNETSDGINWNGYNWTNVQGSGGKDPGIWKLTNGEYIMLASKDSAYAFASVNSITNNKMQIYPNPVNEKLYINIPNEKITKFYLYNSVGDIVLSINNPDENGINLKEIYSGIYFIIVESNSGEILRHKLIKL